MVYVYDYGDDRRHKILLEKKLAVVEGIQYPIVMTARRACPPEDCGGIWGYQSIIGALKGEDVPDKDSLLDWLPADYDPEQFDAPT